MFGWWHEKIQERETLTETFGTGTRLTLVETVGWYWGEDDVRMDTILGIF